MTQETNAMGTDKNGNLVPRIINASAAKALLQSLSNAPTVSAEALEWINRQALRAVEDCAARGRRYPSGRLSCPDTPEALAGQPSPGAGRIKAGQDALALLASMVGEHRDTAGMKETANYKAAVVILAAAGKAGA